MVCSSAPLVGHMRVRLHLIVNAHLAPLPHTVLHSQASPTPLPHLLFLRIIISFLGPGRSLTTVALLRFSTFVAIIWFQLLLSPTAPPAPAPPHLGTEDGHITTATETSLLSTIVSLLHYTKPSPMLFLLIMDAFTRMIYHSIARPVREALWAYVSRRLKYRAKILVDSFGHRLGTSAAAAFALVSVTAVLKNVMQVLLWLVLGIHLSLRYLRRNGDADVTPQGGSLDTTESWSWILKSVDVSWAINTVVETLSQVQDHNIWGAVFSFFWIYSAMRLGDSMRKADVRKKRRGSSTKTIKIE